MDVLIHYYDMVLCFAILLVSCDYLRIVYFFDEPLISTASGFTAVGALGLALFQIEGGTSPLWAVMLHTSTGIFIGYHYVIAIRREAQGIAHRVE